MSINARVSSVKGMRQSHIEAPQFRFADAKCVGIGMSVVMSGKW
jgi:hypothetical protein